MDEVIAPFVGSIKFFGPSVEEGAVDIEKAGYSLVALNKLFKRCVPSEKQKGVSLKLGKVQKNCTELHVILESIAPITTTASILIACKAIGVDELGRQFFGTLGNQLALKLFSKGEELIKRKTIPADGVICVELQNAAGQIKVVPETDYELLKSTTPYLEELIQLESGHEDRMTLGYYEEGELQEVSTITADEKIYFETPSELSLDERLSEDFDESSAKTERIVGKFIDYYGLAHTYHFSFQARKKQDDIGKQKILCKVAESKISEIIDLLKPESQKKTTFASAEKQPEMLTGKLTKSKLNGLTGI